MTPRIYTDTSVIGGCLDEEFKEASLQLINMFKLGTAVLVVSDLTLWSGVWRGEGGGRRGRSARPWEPGEIAVTPLVPGLAADAVECAALGH